MKQTPLFSACAKTKRRQFRGTYPKMTYSDEMTFHFSILPQEVALLNYVYAPCVDYIDLQ